MRARRLVLVLGRGVGDIFRRNALNLGLEVLECPAAAEDARDGHRFRFDPATRRLTNESLGRTYEPKPLNRKKPNSGRPAASSPPDAGSSLASLASEPQIEWPGPEEQRRLTVTEQILWGPPGGSPGPGLGGESILVAADLLPASDGTAPFAIHTFRKITGGAIYPRQAAIANDHFVFTGAKPTTGRPRSAGNSPLPRSFALPGSRLPATGIFHFYFPEQGLVVPGAVVPGADSHSRAYGAYGALGIGIGSTALGFGWATGSVF